MIYQYAKERLSACSEVCPDVVFIAHPDAEQPAIEAAKQALAEDGRFENVIEARAGCTVACHCGPNTLGIMFFRNE